MQLKFWHYNIDFCFSGGKQYFPDIIVQSSKISSKCLLYLRASQMVIKQIPHQSETAVSLLHFYLLFFDYSNTVSKHIHFKYIFKKIIIFRVELQRWTIQRRKCFLAEILSVLISAGEERQQLRYYRFLKRFLPRYTGILCSLWREAAPPLCFLTESTTPSKGPRCVLTG